MPIYRYKCNNCAEIFELYVHRQDPDIPSECPNCGIDEFHQLIISPCRFCFPDGLPSYQDSCVEDLGGEPDEY